MAGSLGLHAAISLGARQSIDSITLSILMGKSHHHVNPHLYSNIISLWSFHYKT